MHFLKIYYCSSNWLAHNFFRCIFLQLFQRIQNQSEILGFILYLFWFLANGTKLSIKRSQQFKMTTFKIVKFFLFFAMVFYFCGHDYIKKVFNCCQQSVWTKISLSKGLDTPNSKIVSPFPQCPISPQFATNMRGHWDN